MVDELSLQFKGNADLVAASVKVLAIDQCGQCKSNTIAKFLLITQTDLAGIVDLGANDSVLVQVVCSTDSEFGGTGTGCPGQLNTTGQSAVDFMVDGAVEFLTIIPVFFLGDTGEQKKSEIRTGTGDG